MTKLIAFLLSAGFMAGQGMFPIPGGHSSLSTSWPNGYAKCGTVTIQAVGSTLTGFTTYIFATQTAIKQTGSGGSSTDVNGYDIVPVVSTSDGTPLAFQTLAYDGTAGSIWMAVNANLSTSTTPVVLCVGNSSITTNQGSTAAWDSSYVGVWPLNNNAASTVVTEYTSHANTGTNVANTSSKTASGPYGSGFSSFGKALTYNGSTDYTDLTSSSDYNLTTPWTIQMWLNPGTMTNFQGIVDRSNGMSGTPTEGYLIELANQGTNAGELRVFTSGAGGSGANSGGAMTSGVWSCVAFKKEAGMNEGIWTVDGTDTPVVFFSPVSGSHTLYLGQQQGGSTFWDGLAADLRISNTDRSQDWIDATCANSTAPSTFASVATLVGP